MILYGNLGFGVRTQDAEIFKKRGSYDMIPHGKEIKVFTGSSNPDLADMICKNLGISLGKSTVTAFADGECSISINEPVRGVDVFIVQSTCKPVNDSLMELLVMIDAMKRASAGRITAVIPYFGYARQDRKAKARDPISAKLVANLQRRSRASLTSRWTTSTARRCLPHTTCDASATAARTWSSSRRTSAAWRARALSP